MGSSGWVRSSAWIWVFSSRLSTTAAPGGSRYRPTMSATFAANSGSLLSLNVPCRCGLRPCFRHSVATQWCETATPSVRAMNRAISRLDQCVNPVSPGGLVRVNASTRARIRAGTCSRGAACERSSSPVAASAAYRASHKSTVGRDTPANSAMSFLRRPSSRHNTIRARVPTLAATSGLLVNACSSARCSSVSFTPAVNTETNVP